MASTAQGVRVDPYRAFNFLITLADSAGSSGGAAQSTPAGGFSECSGIEMSMDIEEYKEGGNNATTLRFPTRIKWTNLRLKRGIALADDLWLWHYGFVQGQVVRRDGVVTLLDEQKNPVKVWSFTRGLPVKWTGPSLNAIQNQVAIEELEIAHEGLKLL
ncbi:MAG: phage tail protein [Candidatus Sulfotelmatobacter sp.]